MSSKMTPRERYKAVINFEKPDRMPWAEAYMTPYMLSWYRDGFPIDKNQELAWEADTNKDPTMAIMDEPTFDKLDLEAYFGFQNLQGCIVPVDLGPIPQYKVKILEKTEESIRIRTKTGKILRYPRNFSGRGAYIMPTYERYPIEDMNSWERYKERLDPENPRRYPKDWDIHDYREVYENYEKGPTSLFINGFHGFGARLMGISSFVKAFYKNSELIEDMIEHWKHYTIETIREAVESLGDVIDYVFWWEDLAERNGPIISPKLYNEYLLPEYKEVTGFFKKNGIDRIMMDSDGNTEAILDSAVEAGITGHWPLEAAAGMDAMEIREKYGEDLFLIGNIDKRKIVKGGEAMREEVDSKKSLFEESKKKGGYILGLDHIIPADCTYKRFKEYADYIKKYF